TDSPSNEGVLPHPNRTPFRFGKERVYPPRVFLQESRSHSKSATCGNSCARICQGVCKPLLQQGLRAAEFRLTFACGEGWWAYYSTTRVYHSCIALRKYD